MNLICSELSSTVLFSYVPPGMSEQDVAEYRKSLAIRTSGFDVPKPIKAFEDCAFSTALMNAIAKHGYEKPTPIQCQALPLVLSGRDIIGIAKTGSRKTAAFVLPMIVHIIDKHELQKEEGPIGVINMCSHKRTSTSNISRSKEVCKTLWNKGCCCLWWNVQT